MRRSRGRRPRPDMLHEDRDRSAPVVPEKAPEKSATKPPAPEDKSHKIKNRIESWLKDAEVDAEKAEMYLDKKREKKEGDSGTYNSTFFPVWISVLLML